MSKRLLFFAVPAIYILAVFMAPSPVFASCGPSNCADCAYQGSCQQYIPNCSWTGSACENGSGNCTSNSCGGCNTSYDCNYFSNNCSWTNNSCSAKSAGNGGADYVICYYGAPVSGAMSQTDCASTLSSNQSAYPGATCVASSTCGGTQSVYYICDKTNGTEASGPYSTEDDCRKNVTQNTVCVIESPSATQDEINQDCRNVAASSAGTGGGSASTCTQCLALSGSNVWCSPQTESETDGMCVAGDLLSVDCSSHDYAAGYISCPGGGTGASGGTQYYVCGQDGKQIGGPFADTTLCVNSSVYENTDGAYCDTSCPSSGAGNGGTSGGTTGGETNPYQPFSGTLTSPFTVCATSGTTDPACVANKIIDFLISLAVPLAAIMVLYGGLQLMTAGDSPEKIKGGRETILYAAAGFVLVLAAKGATALVQSVFGTSSCSGLVCMANKIIDFLTVVAVPIMAIMVLYGGFQLVTAGGNPEKFKSGRTTVLYAAVGFVVILAAKGVVAVIQGLFGL